MEPHLVSLFAPASFEAEQYRALRYSLELARRISGLQVVAVTSAAVADGKTLTAINLAGSLAQAPEARVLLVDADMRRPCIAPYLGLGGRPAGLLEAVLEPERGLEELVQRHPDTNLSILPAGRSQADAYEVLKSPRLGALLEEARRSYDYVVLDTAPIVPVPDTRLIGDRVDRFLLVVAAHRTPRELVAEALNLIDPAKMLGLVFNHDDRPLAGYYGYYWAYYVPASRARRGPAAWWRRFLEKVRGACGER